MKIAWGTLADHMMPPGILLPVATAIALCVVLIACASPPAEKPSPRVGTQPGTQMGERKVVNFSGSWELDYAQSDNTQLELDSLVRELNREAERRAQGNMRQGPVGGGMVIGGAGGNSGSSIIGMVQMADLITQSSLLEIDQDEHKIRVKREADSDLGCEFYHGQLHTVETPFGTEICGWNAHQLVFKLHLPGGLGIQHVMTMGADGQKLNIATTVVTDQVSFPFTLNRVYNRFVPGESGFRCEMTLTKGRVCTTESR